MFRRTRHVGRIRDGAPNPDALLWTWVQIDMTGPTANDFQNVSSLTDNGVGDITVNFAYSYRTADYATVVGGMGTSAAAGAASGSLFSVAAGAVRVLSANTSNTATDATRFGVLVTGLL